jgi:hypothetical protein
VRTIQHAGSIVNSVKSLLVVCCTFLASSLWDIASTRAVGAFWLMSHARFVDESEAVIASS